MHRYLRYHAPRGKPLLAGGQHGSIRFQLHAGHLDAVEKLAVSVRLAYLKLALQGFDITLQRTGDCIPTGVVTPVLLLRNRHAPRLIPDSRPSHADDVSPER